jgi:predicted amidophosphoribosyltransferase
MPQTSCPDCHLRFTASVAAYVTVCPCCGEPLQKRSAEAALGLQLFRPDGPARSFPEAVAVAMPARPAPPLM